MTFRIGWLSPFTPSSGIGTFSHAVTERFPERFGDQPIDLTILYVGNSRIYDSKHRLIQIEGSEGFHEILSLFDLLVYNIGNNKEHHDGIFDLLRKHPGVIVCHDYVYQHYLADRSIRFGQSFSSYAALLLKYGSDNAPDYLRRSRITSRTGAIRYSPWDSEASVTEPMSEVILDHGSALVVHSAFAERHVEPRFSGPVLRLGMPHDQKPARREFDTDAWAMIAMVKPSFTIVSFGHIQPTKCTDLVLSAIAGSRVLRRKLRYVIAGFVGDADYLADLRAFVASAGLRDIVSFETGVTDARLLDLMDEADIFINLRKPNTEGSSASLIEQLDVGKPVIVLDSGCYAEIPDDAAVKLPADVGSTGVQTALERLIASPELMPVIGRAGRAYARRWTCESYAAHFLQFACDHRVELEERARFTAVRSRSAAAMPERDDAWTRKLGRARASFDYFDRNILALDPAIVSSKNTDELCDYVAHVLFGIFGNPRLQRALSRFFAARRGGAAYWACVRFSLIVEAVFADQDSARQRLAAMGPCYELEFWDVVENFPPRQYFLTAALMLGTQLPASGEYIKLDDADGFPKRLRMLELVRSIEPDADGGLERLRSWLEQPCDPVFEGELPLIEGNFESQVGSEAFRRMAELSGFYTVEKDHVWARGHRGFIGLRLGSNVIRVEALVRHAEASGDDPARIGLSSGKASAEIEVGSYLGHWISLEISRHLVEQSSTLWFELSTDRAGPPPNNVQDTRILGAGLLRLRIRTKGAAIADRNRVADATVA